MKNTLEEDVKRATRTHIMTMRKPAFDWHDAIPGGNGRLGAMVYGAIYDETILLNHENLWYGHNKKDISWISCLGWIVDILTKKLLIILEGTIRDVIIYVNSSNFNKNAGFWNYEAVDV